MTLIDIVIIIGVIVALLGSVAGIVIWAYHTFETHNAVEKLDKNMKDRMDKSEKNLNDRLDRMENRLMKAIEGK